jgi:alpha-N-arabinofuranosidase
MLLFTVSGYAQNQRATIDISQTKDRIEDKLFGMFMENLGNQDVGNLTDDCLWAELLDDRKFFYPVDTIEALTPINKKEKINQWVPVGNAVIMDSSEPYVGRHSPKVTTAKGAQNGIAQTGIALIGKKQYTGRVVLKATTGVIVSVSLTWGDKPSDRQTVTLPALNAAYTSYAFSFTANKSFPKATLQITGQGAGSFTIGAVSLMPADNIDGFRPDVIKLLKDLHSAQYRWGGNFISNYDWRDGVGNQDKRAPRYEYAWECLEDNDVGTPEMIRFAELIGVDLAMTVNTGFGDAYSAAQWVEYVNGAPTTDMGKLRAANGHPEPYGIKLWCVGNESYGWWQLGHIPLKHHIIKHNSFAEKMLEKDPTLQLIGSGASIEEMTVTESAYRTDGKVVPEYDSETDWTGGMLRNANSISYMSEHFYCSVNELFDLEKHKYAEVTEPLEDWTRRPANRIKSKALHYAEYHKRIPGSEKIPVYLDEWTYYTNWVHPRPSLGVTIGHARGLHELFRNTGLFKMAGFTFGTSCLSFTDTAADYNSTGLMFKLYQEHFGRIPVEIKGASPQPAPKWPVGGDQPAVNAGGDVYPLDMVAALTPDGKTLTLSIINPTEKQQSLTLDFGSVKIGKVKKYTMTGTSIDARNIVNQKPQVTVIETTVKYQGKAVPVPPASLNIYHFELL